MQARPIKVIITGATGMVGEGVMQVSLASEEVEEVLVINRRPCGVSHPKLKEIIHEDFFNLEPIASQLSGYNACFFCLGVSSVGMKKEQYYHLTYDLTLHVAQLLSRQNADMTFCYISGAGTDSTEQGRSNWARVKGKTENDLLKLPFKEVYAFRPGFIKPFEGLRNVHRFYNYIGWMFPIGRGLYPSGFCTMKELASAMIYVVNQPQTKNIIEGKDIIRLAH